MILDKRVNLKTLHYVSLPDRHLFPNISRRLPFQLRLAASESTAQNFRYLNDLDLSMKDSAAQCDLPCNAA